MSSQIRKPAISVVIVSDYHSGEAAGWDDMRATLRALANQEFDGEAEFLLVESTHYVPQIPPDVLAILPTLKVVPSPHTSSYALKNEGGRAATADLVALLDADCLPDRDWLREIVATMERYPEAAAVSGRLRYPGRTVSERALMLVTRSYMDVGRAEQTRHLAETNVVHRRSGLLAHPLPERAGPFSAILHGENLLRAGAQIRFEPRIRAVHLFGGWATERDIRRNLGYTTIVTRRLDPRIPFAWVVRLGLLAVPLMVIGGIVRNWWRCIRAHRQYDVPWYELPIAMSFSVALYAMEVPAMVRALRGGSVAETAYR